MFDATQPVHNWVAFTRRTNEPKLKFIEGWLDNLQIPHRRNGASYHAPILEVPSTEYEVAYTEILMAESDSWQGIFDDVEDDDPLFEEGY